MFRLRIKKFGWEAWSWREAKASRYREEPNWAENKKVVEWVKILTRQSLNEVKNKRKMKICLLKRKIRWKSIKETK